MSPFNVILGGYVIRPPVRDRLRVAFKKNVLDSGFHRKKYFIFLISVIIHGVMVLLDGIFICSGRFSITVIQRTGLTP